MNSKLDIRTFFNGLTKHTMHLVEEFYDEQIEFHDPLVNIRGLAQMKKYYENLYQYVRSIDFEFFDEVAQGDARAAVWKMTVVSALKKGQPVELDGISYIKFGGPHGRAIYQRDYYDMGQFVYEDIPVLGAAIRLIKRKLRHDS